ncbi:TolC family protein [Sphingomonas flavalba]|uniref:TolC family protein n=1 Tax=Sphingomonas flavalba TaxID=2559804 RepID=UPI00109DD8DB|nr:TolC family protein [Sphingomonas flavalba]
MRGSARLGWVGALSAVLLASAAAHGQRTDLPVPELVAAALDNHPTVLAAAARLDAARAQADMLRAGPHEITVEGGYARRSIEMEGRFGEFDATISRPIRLPGKAALDRRAGGLIVDVARNRLADVRHAMALTLGRQWYDWLTATALARTDAEAVANLEQALAAVSRQIALRDAAALDGERARSALALARAQMAESRARAAAARAVLAASFPELPLPVDPPVLAEPAAFADGLPALRDRAVTESHAIAAARAEAGRHAVLADRARADRVADPSLGIRLFSERGGMEKGAGLVASIPIGGRHRAAAVDDAAAAARSVALELTATEREVEAAASAALSNARMLLDVWRDIAEAAAQAQAVADRTVRGRALGAIDLADQLYAERQAREARRAEITARGEALRAMLRLEVDAHMLWAAQAG